MTKAIAFTEFGTPDVLRTLDVDLPEPGAGQVRIAVHRAYPLAEAADAQRESETGHVTGKIVLTV